MTESRNIDWRAVLVDWIEAEVVVRLNNKWYHHSFGSYGYTTKEEAVRVLIEEAIRRSKAKRED